MYNDIETNPRDLHQTFNKQRLINLTLDVVANAKRPFEVTKMASIVTAVEDYFVLNVPVCQALLQK